MGTIVETENSILNQLLQNLSDNLKQLPTEQLIHTIKSESFYILHYRNSNGITSKRVIKVYALSPTIANRQDWKYHNYPGGKYSGEYTYSSFYQHTYIQAYCYLKREDRTFRLDRVISLYEANFIINRGFTPAEIQQAIVSRNNTVKSQITEGNKPPAQTRNTKNRPAKTILKTILSKIFNLSLIIAFIIGMINFDYIQKQFDKFFKVAVVNTIVVKPIKPKTKNTEISDLLESLLKNENPSEDFTEENLPRITFIRMLTVNVSSIMNYEKNLITTTTTQKDTFIPFDLSSLKSNSTDTKSHLIKKLTYRGITIQVWSNNYGKKYYAPSVYTWGYTLNQIKRKINDKLFEQRTKIYNPRLNKMYANADLNGDWKLSWYEIKKFQKRLYTHYKYIPNKIALKPDQFIQQGGGDCEDWALMTAGLLTYWGYKAYVGTLSNKNYPEGHAICLAYSPTKPPKGIGYIKVHKGSPLLLYNLDNPPSGYYIPIDYTTVGGYSTAITSRKRGKWYYSAIYLPERIYGWFM